MSRVLLIAAAVATSISVWAQNVVSTLPELVSTIDHPVFKSGDYDISRHYTDAHNGVSHAYGYQTLNGIEIEGAYFGAHSQGGKIIALNEGFVEQVPAAQAQKHTLDHSAAVDAYFSLYSEQFASGLALSASWEAAGPNQYQWIDLDVSPEAIRVKKTYALHEGVMTPSWSLSVLFPDNSHWYYAVVSAVDGSLIDQHDWMISCSVHHDHSAHAFHMPEEDTEGQTSNKKADGASYRVFEYPIESPNHGDWEAVEDPADETASPYGWHDVDGADGPEYTITRGNNVYASEDRNSDNQPGYSPDGGSDLDFDFPYAREASHDDNLDGAITNLFYANNVMHDIFYHYGFDEQSGNFQENNYGNHTSGDGDGVNADAQDGSGTNNANFATPTDGINPRMQMFLWGATGGLRLVVDNPAGNAGTYVPLAASFGPSFSSDPIKAKLVLVDDGATNPREGCNAVTNADDLKGNIALIERGTCTFVTKVRNAQDAGAIAVIIFTDNRNPISMGGDGTQGDIEIPSVMIERDLGLDLVDELAKASFEVSIFNSTFNGGRDSDFDNGVIAHEFGHGISTRLTGGPLNSNCLRNAEQMGEGWSDFFALVTTHRENHTATSRRAIGVYSSGQANGIRPYVYSTNTNASRYTYEQIATLSQPHGVGSVWCAMLWDLYWSMIDEYGYDPDIYEGTGGNNMCIQLVVDGMKLQSCNPSFMDARDGILLADKVNNDGENERLIWEAFAGRGLGWNAEGGDGNDRTDGKNGFDLPPKFDGFVGIKKTALAEIGETEDLVYTIEVENASDETYFDVVVTDTVPEELIIDETSFDCGWERSGQVLTLNIDELSSGQIVTCTFTTNPKPGFYSKSFAEDGAEDENESWSTLSELGDNVWTRQFATRAEGLWAWKVDNAPSSSDQSLLFNIGVVDAGTILSFQHSYNTDPGRDGGVIEFTEDGENWFDAENDFIENGYNGEVTDNPTTTLNGRAMFTGNSDGFITSQIDLTRFAGQDLIVRFRFASDRRFQQDGWYVDDLKVGNFVEVNNRAYATAGAKVSMDEVLTVIMDTDASNSLYEAFNPNPLAEVYPNPATEMTHVILPTDAEGVQMTINNLSGQQLVSDVLTGGYNQLSLENLAQGTYILSLTINGVTERHRLVKN